MNDINLFLLFIVFLLSIKAKIAHSTDR
jgi:hypothetical protein